MTSMTPMTPVSSPAPAGAGADVPAGAGAAARDGFAGGQGHAIGSAVAGKDGAGYPLRRSPPGRAQAVRVAESPGRAEAGIQGP